MTQHETKSAIVFSTYVADRTRDFAGRQWVLQAIGRWLGNCAGLRVFLLTGEPGGGKMAVIARLAETSDRLRRPRSDT